MTTAQLRFTAILHKEEECYVSLCPELDIASQGASLEEAKHNLKEAVELFFECASTEEINQRYYGETYISSLTSIIRQAQLSRSIFEH